MKDNLYDTTIYTDYDVLPEQTKKALFDEWLKKHPAEKKVRNFCKFTPLVFASITAGFIIASLVTGLTIGFGITCVLLLVAAGAALVFCVIFNERAHRLTYGQSERYAKWLFSEKRVIAELIPPKKSREDKDDNGENNKEK